MNNFIKTFGTLSALMGVFFAFNFYANYGGNLDRAIFVGVLSGLFSLAAFSPPN